MSWCVTINNLPEFLEFDAQLLEDAMTQHIQYPQDMYRALGLARLSQFKSCVLTGFRTPNPYGGDEVAEISVKGMMEATDFQAEMKRIIQHGGDQPNDKQTEDEAVS